MEYIDITPEEAKVIDSDSTVEKYAQIVGYKCFYKIYFSAKNRNVTVIRMSASNVEAVRYQKYVLFSYSTALKEVAKEILYSGKFTNSTD